MKSKVLALTCLCLAMTMLLAMSGCVRIKKTGLVNWDRTTGLAQRKDVNDKKTKKLTENLTSKGVQVVSMGQDYQIKVPARMIFHHGSPKVIWGSYALLGDITALLTQYRIVNLYVEANVDEGKSYARDYALAKARARAVADFISAKSDSARIVVARGYNQRVVKEQNMIKSGEAVSDIVISFRNRIV